MAGLAGALLPLKPQVEVRGDWEAGLASLLFTVLVGLMVRQWEKRDWKMRDAAWLGFCWGLAVLVHSSLLLAVGLVLAGELWRTGHRGNDGGGYLRYGVRLGAVVLLVQVPWVCRNYRELGALVITRSSLGLELWMSNQERAEPVLLNNESINRQHPGSNREEAARVRAMGEIAYNRMRLEEAKAWALANPGKFVWLTTQRWLYHWFPMAPPLPVGRRVLMCAVTALALLGYFQLWRRKRSAAAVIGLAVLGHAAVYALIYTHVRHRYPVDALLLLLGSFPVAGWVKDRTGFNG